MRDPFETFRECAFRFEALDHYSDDPTGNSGELDHFLQYGVTEEGHNSEWASLIEAAVQRGGVVRRLRAVSSPPSPYENYELRAGYGAGRAAGETIRVVDRMHTNADDPDYWLYDDDQIEILHYGERGEFLGSTVRSVQDSDRRMIEEHRRLFEAAATPEEYLSDIAQG